MRWRRDGARFKAMAKINEPLRRSRMVRDYDVGHVPSVTFFFNSTLELSRTIRDLQGLERYFSQWPK